MPILKRRIYRARCRFQRRALSRVLDNVRRSRARDFRVDLRSHPFHDVVTADAISRLNARNTCFNRRDDNDRRIALLPIVALEEQRNDVHGNAVASFLFNLGRACTDGGMNDRVEGVALTCIGKYDRRQRGSVDRTIANYLRPPLRNRSKARCPRLDDFARKLIGVDNRRAELRECARYLALARADSAGETHAHH
jgi:hypothetical protein